MNYEYCLICDERTGRAGRADDSIFLTLMTNFALYVRGDDIGPLCEDCRNAFVQLKLAEDK